MDDGFVILIADRNRHVREFLRRELVSEGYRVQVAKDGREVMMIIDGYEPPDLLILDLEIPFAGGLPILERLRDRKPPLPVVIHTFLTEYANHPAVQDMTSFVEKRGNTDSLKAAVMEMLRKSRPRRFDPVEDSGGEAEEETYGEE